MIRMIRLYYLRILIFVAMCVFTTHANARYLYPKSFFVTGLATQLNDVGTSASSAESHAFPKNITQVEAGVRAMNIFCLSLIGQKGEENANDIQGYGLGLRVDLPGFFLIGGTDQHFRRRAKGYPFNTSLFMQSIKTRYMQGAAETNTITSRYGLTVEVFPFQTMVYITLEAGIYNFAGNSFANSGVGLGLQF